MSYVYNLFGGISEFYAFVFTIAVIVLAFRGLLTGPMVGAIGAIQTLIVGLDIHNDLQNKLGDPNDRDRNN